MPSYFETFCISIAEAMYFGLPVIATNVGGVPSVLDHNKNGILIEKGDSDLLAKSIIDLLKQPGKMEMFSKEGKNKAMSTFTLQSVVEKSINIYNLL
jgi:glycosyltransferase involved in cell wall biosynthesis